jgi:ElaB/YqjD/DUF883 family membrane-anchored ribosome-binding protein
MTRGMGEIERRIREKIETFVQELNELVREAALDAVSEALGSSSRPRKKSQAGKPRIAPRVSGQKRTQTEIDRMAKSAQSYVEKHPGEGVIAIAKALGVTSKDLVLPMKKLLAGGTLMTRGNKRATKYYPK